MRYGSSHYLKTPEGLLAQHRKRDYASLGFLIYGVEPRAKHSMPSAEKTEIQRQILATMSNTRRRAFTGPVALRIRMHTTEKTPTHAHHIAKNLLDLFGKPLPYLDTRRKSLLYADDRQVHALSVSCVHGQKDPCIMVNARPLRHLLQEVELVVGLQGRGLTNADMMEEMNFEHHLDHYRDLRMGSVSYASWMSKDTYEAWLRGAQQRAQEALFSRHQTVPRDLYHLFDLGTKSRLALGAEVMWDEMFALSPFRIGLSELPQVKGASALWKKEIDAGVRDFRDKFAWIIDPLLIPTALEVVVRPPAPNNANSLHDLDNIVRTYLLPKIVEILKPVSDHSFTIDFDAIERNPGPEMQSPSFAEWVRNRKTPPPSTRVGINRYEVWRLPPAMQGEKGFVSVAIVADVTGTNDLMGRLSLELEVWKKYQENQ